MTIKTEQTTGPLNGFKILDFTRAYAGPYATMMLADMGATVIKIEPPEGDPTRQLGPYLNKEDKDCGLGGFNSSVNRNKRSISLNLKNPDAQKVAQELAKECDALILNFSTPKIMSKYNLDYDTIKKINPKIVYVSISGYGTNRIVPSLYEGKPTIDMMMQAESGTLSITGSPDGEMYKVGPGIGDTYTGTCAIVAMLAALLHTKQTGVGQFIDIAMMDSMVMLSERILYQYAYTGVSPKPIGNRHPLQSPYSLYHTSDGAIVLAAFPDRYWDRLVEAMDLDILRNDPRFKTKETRLQNQDELDKVIEGWTSTRTKAEAMKVLDKQGCLAAPVNTAADLFSNEQIAKREMLVEVEGHPKTKQKVKITGTPFKFSETAAQIYHRAPLNGEDSVDLLQQLGYDKTKIDELISSGSVVVPKL
ncbi:CoA transferase [Betaproteobacteria bacterium]|nr:CoA transferase [Betaproteobacteria bacterium]